MPLAFYFPEIIEHELESSGRLWEPCFICDHPRDISPLTKIKRGNPDFVERFEPHIANFEMGNAYSELTDPVEQYKRFLAQRSEDTEKEYEEHPIDMDFVHAIACGMPPTGGVGYGVDRLVMLLTGKESIRDVIPFPKTTSALCLLTGSPTEADPNQLEDLGLKKTKG